MMLEEYKCMDASPVPMMGLTVSVYNVFLSVLTGNLDNSFHENLSSLACR